MNSASTPNCFVTQLDLNHAEKLKKDLEEQGFEISHPSYTIFQAKKKGISCTFYESGKLTVQGSGMRDFIQYYLEPEILGKFTFGYELVDINLSARIGVDESGKGDFFGPLCVAGVYANGNSVKKLAELGAKDSKKMSDKAIKKVAELIKKEYAYNIVRINPAKYNELYEKFGNLNILLGWGHATVIDNLVEKTGCTNVIIDRFAAEYVVANAMKRKNKTIQLLQRTHAEEDLVVAAASILARAAFLEGLEKMGRDYNLEFPKGASAATINAGKILVEKHGSEVLKNVGKVHFKTYQVILNPTV